MPQFELQTRSRKKVRAEGVNPDDAARRYTRENPGEIVIAWRTVRETNIILPSADRLPRIIEPGDKP